MARTKNFDEREALEKILALFRRKGFFQTTLEDIMRIAGISKQSVYDTFGDKRALFLRALKLYRETTTFNMDEYIRRELERGTPCVDILRVMLYPKESAAGEIKCCLMTNSMIEFRGEDEQICAEISGFLSFLRDQMERVIIAGQCNGEITDKISASRLADVLLNVRNGVQVGQDFNLSANSLEDTVDWTIELIGGL